MPYSRKRLWQDHRMETFELHGHRYGIFRATREDVPALAALLADDMLGQSRESSDLAAYYAAFEAIDADPNHFLMVTKDSLGTAVATMQLTVIPGLSRGGATRLQIEAVRIAPGYRSRGLGSILLEWAHDYGRSRGASLVQLTCDKARTDAHRFYERAGYSASHEGFKREL